MVCPSRKRAYATYKRAAQAAANRGKKISRRLYAYKCHDCKQFHMTSQPNTRRGKPPDRAGGEP